MPQQPIDQVVGQGAGLGFGREANGDLARLIAVARAGDDAALGQLSEVYREYLLHIATKELGSDLRAKMGASDLVQDALVDFKTTITRLRGDSDTDLRAYLRQVLLNRIANAGRRYRQASKRDISLEVSLNDGLRQDRSGNGACAGQLIDHAQTPRTRAIADEEGAQVRAALSRLPDDFRMVIELRDMQGKPWEEVGTALRRSADAARQLWYRAIEELRQVWELQDGDSPS
jgi:RNA polymerase sigma-70 factor, ECF subfamily